LLVNSCESQLHYHKWACCKKHQLVHRFHFPYPHFIAHKYQVHY
jgi:hypothetical protein